MNGDARHGGQAAPETAFILGVTLLMWFGVAAAQPVVSPPKGSAQRVEVLGALRPTVEKEVGGDIVFVVHAFNVMGTWAYVSAEPKRPNGDPIDWRATKFRREVEADVFSGLVLALLRQQGGSWKVTEYVIGPTDVTWVEWIAKYKLPEDLFRGP
jgi:hypothetical protein